MKKMGKFLVFEATSKCGKTTLSKMLKDRLENDLQQEVILKRGALSTSEFGQKVGRLSIADLGYSSSFYWADLVFDTMDCIKHEINAGKIVIQDRYDLSVVTYREIHGMQYDSILLDEYLQRGMMIKPDLTIFLRPPLDAVIRRIKESSDSTEIDKKFLSCPEKLEWMQTRIEHHLVRLNRNFVMYDTDDIGALGCLELIMKKIGEGGW